MTWFYKLCRPIHCYCYGPEGGQKTWARHSLTGYQIQSNQRVSSVTVTVKLKCQLDTLKPQAWCVELESRCTKLCLDVMEMYWICIMHDFSGLMMYWNCNQDVSMLYLLALIIPIHPSMKSCQWTRMSNIFWVKTHLKYLHNTCRIQYEYIVYIWYILNTDIIHPNLANTSWFYRPYNLDVFRCNRFNTSSNGQYMQNTR